jgi:hypothetical protein
MRTPEEIREFRDKLLYMANLPSPSAAREHTRNFCQLLNWVLNEPPMLFDEPEPPRPEFITGEFDRSGPLTKPD